MFSRAGGNFMIGESIEVNELESNFELSSVVSWEKQGLIKKADMQIMPSFLPNDAVSDTTEARPCTIADLIKNKNTLHLLFQMQNENS